MEQASDEYRICYFTIWSILSFAVPVTDKHAATVWSFMHSAWFYSEVCVLSQPVDWEVRNRSWAPPRMAWCWWWIHLNCCNIHPVCWSHRFTESSNHGWWFTMPFGGPFMTKIDSNRGQNPLLKRFPRCLPQMETRRYSWKAWKLTSLAYP